MKTHEKLRQPEFDKRRNTRSLTAFLQHRKLDIARPFPEWPLPEAPSWKEDPFDDDTWGLYYHTLGWLVILDHGLDCLDDSEDRDRCARELRELFFSYLKFLDDTPSTDAPKMAWFDHSTAWRASAIAYFVSKHFQDSLLEEDEALVKRSVLTHVAALREFIDSGRWNANNHGLFHAEALWDLTRVFKWLDHDLADLAIDHMRTVFANMIDFKEGVCREQSIYYHLFDASLLAHSSEFMQQHGIELFPNYQDILARMLQFYADFSAGGSFIHCVGDTQYGKPAESRLLTEIAAAASCAERPSTPSSSQLVSYTANGYHFFRTKLRDDRPGTNAIFIDKPYMGAHGHNDGASLLLSVGEEPFLIDSGGPYAYGKDLRFNYFKASEGHNVALFGGLSLPYLTQLKHACETPLGCAVRLDSKGLKAGLWHRTVASLKSGTIVVIDGFSLSSTQSIDTLFHVSPDIDVETLEAANFRLHGKNSTVSANCFSNASLQLVLGSGSETFPRGMITRELGKWEPAPVVSVRLEARHAWLTTVLSPTAEPVRPQVFSVYGGKMLRIMIPESQPIAIDCNMEDGEAPVRFYSFRSH